MDTAKHLHEVITQEWGNGLIRSWNDAQWFAQPVNLGNRISPWIGAQRDEVIVTDSTSINLFKVLSSAIKIIREDFPKKRILLSEISNFPTDLYIAHSLCQQNGWTLKTVASKELNKSIDDQVGVVMLTHVNYRNGSMHDMKSITNLAHEVGALCIWDLAHSAGAVPVNLHESKVDFAIGCGYKYLNGGPGAPAFVWCHPSHTDRFSQPLSGWWGHDSPFQFKPEYVPAHGISRYLCGSQSVLSMAALSCGLETLEASIPFGGIEAIRNKSLALTDLFIQLAQEQCGEFNLNCVTPETHANRGSQVSFSCEMNSYLIMQALIERNVIGDFRLGNGTVEEPDLMRFGFAPLYVGYEDIWHAVAILKNILETGEWQDMRFKAIKEVT